MTGRDKLAFLARKRTVVDGKSHLHGGFLYLDELHRFYLGRFAYRIPDIQPVDSRKHHDIPRFRRRDGNSFQSLDLIEIGDFTIRAHFIVVIIANTYGLVGSDGTALDTADSDTADKFVIIDTGNQQLRGAFRIHFHRRNMGKYCIKKRIEVILLFIGREGGCPRTSAAVYDGTFQLFVRGVQIHHQL